MVGSPGEPAVENLHAADFDDAVLLFDFQAGGFRIKNDLAHLKGYRAASRRSIATLASLIDVFIAFMSRMSL